MAKGQVVVIGAGALGCAVAERLSREGFACVVAESGPRIAEGVTSRNSGVIHSGLYYPPTSLKARTCVRGQALIYEWCARKGVPHSKMGKWVVGNLNEEEELERLRKNALASGAGGIGTLTRHQLPSVSAPWGFFCSESGIIDPYEFTLSLRIAAEECGAIFVTQSKVERVEKTLSGYCVHTARGTVECELVVNCAGLYADEIAQLDGISNFVIHPWRGDYFRLNKPVPWRQLIYPVKSPHSPGLGVHLTLGLDGSARLGPDVEPQKSKEDFSPPPLLAEKAAAFLAAASRYLAGIQLEDLTYDTCGLRPKLRAPNDKMEQDFELREGSPGFWHCIGIESPGLTAALALADEVARRIQT